MTLSKPALRVIINDPLPATENMSIDQAILESTELTQQPTLRFYRWRPATLSIGYFQKIADRSSHRASLACPIVRRASGGGAIIHDHEITYSLCVATAGSRARANTDLYNTVHNAIRESLLEQGIAVTLFTNSESQSTRARPSDPFLCFERRSEGDLICNGSKIGGSAQRRLKKALIQHGSILLGQSQFAPELPGINELTNTEVNEQQLLESITGRLAASMSLTSDEQDLTESEIARSNQISSQKFENEQWLNKR